MAMNNNNIDPNSMMDSTFEDIAQSLLQDAQDANTRSIVPDEVVTSKEQWYDLKKYKGEIENFVVKKRYSLDISGRAQKVYDRLYRSIFAGTEETDVERFPHSAEMYKVYKAAIIAACLRGYSALVVLSAPDGYSTLKLPELRQTMINQFKGVALLENLSSESLDDWILKGEAVAFIKLKETVEEYRIRQTMYDTDTGEDMMKFTVKQGVSYQNLEIERIDPLDFFVDAVDYARDPRGCTKIIRSWIDSQTLLSSNQFPLLSKEDKEAIANKNNSNKNTFSRYFNWGGAQDKTLYPSYSATDNDQIEVLTFYGDYVTNDNKILKNIKAITVCNKLAYLDYNTINTNRIIYAPYKIDRRTHRSVSPLAVANPINKLVNRATDMLLQNLDDVTNPIMLYAKGSITAQQAKEAIEKRQLEYNDIDSRPEFYAPPAAGMTGVQLIQMVLEQNKNVLGVNQYIAGDTSGAVRTAQESAILEQNANARMRVETDVYSYKFLLPLFNAFYAFNRELALACNNPLAPIYQDPDLRVSISTSASRADEQGEFQRLMQILNLPIAQMIFSNLNPEQITMAVRYIMSKAELKDGDNLLELFDETGERQYPIPEDISNNNSRGNNDRTTY